MFNKKCKIIFVRNGSTIYTEEKRLYDEEDYPPINQKGKEEIQSISKWLNAKASSIDLIYCSSALRSIQSARILSKLINSDYEIIEELGERKAGIWSGLTFEQIECKYPEMLDEYHRNPCSFWPEGGESTTEMKTRVGKILDKLIPQNKHKRLVIVSHQGVIQSAISHALDINPKHQSKIYIPNGSATQINYYEEWASLVYSGYVPIPGI